MQKFKMYLSLKENRNLDEEKNRNHMHFKNKTVFITGGSRELD